MKKLLSLLLLAAALVACEKNDNPKPVDVTFTEYSLASTSSRWANLGTGDEDGMLFVINSDEELRDHIIGQDYPTIDFSNKTLLLACGSTTNGVYGKSVKSFQMLSTNRYLLDVEVILNRTDIAEGWMMAFVTDRLSPKSDIELNVTLINRHDDLSARTLGMSE